MVMRIEAQFRGALWCALVGMASVSGCALQDAEPDVATETASEGLSAATMTPRASFRTGEQSPAKAEFRVLTGWVPPGLADKQGREKLAPPAAPVDPRAKAARAFAALQPGSQVSATIVLDEPAFDWDGYRAAGHAAQGSLLQGRRATLRQAQ